MSRPLDIAVKKNKPQLVRLLVENGADLEWTNCNHETVLFAAVKQRKLGALRELLCAGANVNHERFDGKTVLFTAAKAGDVEIVKLLISYGADVNVQLELEDKAIDVVLHDYSDSLWPRKGSRAVDSRLVPQ